MSPRQAPVPQVWQEPQESELPTGLIEVVGGRALLAQALARRGIQTAEAAQAYLDPACYSASPAWELPGMEATVDRLVRAIRKGESIWVWGDFDVDGQTSTAILVSALRELGANVSYHIPVRATESHGVNLPKLGEIIAAGAKLVLTCDTGISAQEAAQYAQEQGIDFLISDHHELPPVLPEALAIVNSRFLPASHPLSELPGAGVAYQIAQGLGERLGKPSLAENLVDLAALGIVADMAPLRGENRYLVQKGLLALRSSPRPSLQAIYEFAGLDPTNLSEEHIGFLIGPRLNAWGRLGDANPAVEFLLTQDMGRARVVAQQLEGLNADRRLKTSQIFQGALAAIEQEPGLLDSPILVLGNPAWPAGVIGIVASRLVEYFHKPAILFSAPPGEPARGSARSVEGINITQAIAAVRAAHPELVLGFGGHPMAAGLSLAPNQVDRFRILLGAAVREIGQIPVEKPLILEGVLPVTELDLDFVYALERLAPFGQGNPPLVLLSPNLKLVNATTVGQEGEHLTLTVEDSQGERRKAIWWQGADWPLPEGLFDLAYSVRSSTYQGQRELQIEWIDFRPCEEKAVTIASSQKEIIDFRNRDHPIGLLKKVAAEREIEIWGEAEAKTQLTQQGLIVHQRLELVPGETLIIWTTPPSKDELKAALEKTDAKAIYFFCVEPVPGTLNGFLQRLAGLIKYSLHDTQGKVDLASLAAASAQRELVVKKGIEWLEAAGHIRIQSVSEEELIVSPGSGEANQEASEAFVQLKYLWEETHAFREFLRKADVQNLSRLFFE